MHKARAHDLTEALAGEHDGLSDFGECYVLLISAARGGRFDAMLDNSCLLVRPSKPTLYDALYGLMRCHLKLKTFLVIYLYNIYMSLALQGQMQQHQPWAPQCPIFT